MDGSEFVSISEAWSVLSKPELRKQYDDTRRKYLVPSNVNGGTSVSSFPYSYEISENYQVQKMNYGNVKHRASSNWKDLRDKYQTDKWKELPLSKKKVCLFRLFSFTVLTVLLIVTQINAVEWLWVF